MLVSGFRRRPRLNAPIRNRHPMALVVGTYSFMYQKVCVVDRIDVNCRIIAPAMAAGLRAGPVDDGSFAEGHLARRIAVRAGRYKTRLETRMGWCHSRR